MAILGIIWKRRNLVFGNILMWTLFAGATTAFHEPRYTASSYIFPNINGAEFHATISTLDKGDITKTVIDQLGLMNTPEYNLSIPDNASVTAKFLQSAENLEFKGRNIESYAIEKLKENISIEAIESSSAFRISVISTDPTRAANITNATKDAIIDLLTTPSSERIVFAKGDIRGDNAQATYSPTPPAFLKVFLMGAIAGLFIGIFTSIWREIYFQKKVRL